MSYLFLFCYILVTIGTILFILSSININKKKLNLKGHKKSKYAILIPARDESMVIEKLLKSIKDQNGDMQSTYIIVEDKKDKTCEIANKYDAKIYVRKKPIKSRKGYALDECIKDILKKKHYDLYFIIDADNVLDKNFINSMLSVWQKGYDVATGYRNILNPVNSVSGCSIIMFSLLNYFVNKAKEKNNESIVLTGTGFYISGEIIESLGGFPFHSLTEDYELSMYLSSLNISSCYNTDAIFYDEQPVSLNSSIKQRTRWIKGLIESRKKRKKEIKINLYNRIGIWHLITFFSGIIGLIILNILTIFIYNKGYLFLILILFTIYLILFLLTLIILIKEKNIINLDKKLMIKCLFFNPIFLITFIICFIKGILSKDMTWHKIKHDCKHHKNL